MSSGEHHTGGPISVFHGHRSVLEAQPESSHTEHALTYVATGSLRVHHGAPLTLGPGMVALVPAGVPHRLLGGEDVELWVTTFCAGCLSLDEHHVLMRPFYQVRRGSLPAVPIPEGRRDRVLRLFDDLGAEVERADATSRELSRCVLLLLLGEVRRAMQGRASHPEPGSLVGDALAFIQAHCLDPISLRDVAAAVHRTPAHVATQVKEATGYTVGGWIAAGRVAEAAARLAHTDERVAEIGAHVGWRDTTHFIRQFKKVYGLPPGAWRRAQRERAGGEAGGPDGS